MLRVLCFRVSDLIKTSASFSGLFRRMSIKLVLEAIVGPIDNRRCDTKNENFKNDIISDSTKDSSATMMEVLITFPLRSFDIDLDILEEFMLIIYRPLSFTDDR